MTDSISDKLAKGLAQIVKNLNSNRTRMEKVKGVEYGLDNHKHDDNFMIYCRNYCKDSSSAQVALIMLNEESSKSPEFSDLGYIYPDKNLHQLREYLHAFSHAYDFKMNKFARWFSEVNPHSIENYSEKKQ